MSSMELNKILGAVLLAGLIAMLTSFMAHTLVAPEPLERVAYMVGEPPAAAVAEAAPTGPEPIAPLLASADVDVGARVARACAACHSFEKGGTAKVGPNLYDIINAKHGHMEGFSYSAVIAGMDGPWDYDALNRFIYAPRAYAPGTKMTFAGLRNTQERANLIAWLRTLSDNPAPLPQ